MNVAKDTTAGHLKDLYEKIEAVKVQNEKFILETINLLIPNHWNIEILRMEDLYWRLWAQRSMELQRMTLPGTLGLEIVQISHLENLERRRQMLEDRIEGLKNNA